MLGELTGPIAMNVLRSVFISVFSTYIALAFIYALVQLVRGMDPLFSWLGLALAAGSPLAFLRPSTRSQ
jgi:hypothetical protein